MSSTITSPASQIKTYACRVAFSKSLLTITHVSSGKAAQLDRSQIILGELLAPEANLLKCLTSLRERAGDTYERDFTKPEMQIIASLRDSQVISTQAPPTTQQPVSIPEPVVVPSPEPVAVVVTPVVVEVAKPPQVVASTIPTSTSQVERDVNRAMDSRQNGMAKGFRTMEARTLDMQRVLGKLMSEGGLVLVNYYIPVELSVNHAEVLATETTPAIPAIPVRILNPASSFRGFAIHLDGSNWLMTAEGLECDVVRDFFANMDEYKEFVGREGEPPAYWSTQLREEEYKKFLLIAQKKFENHIRNLHTSLIECIASADQALVSVQNSPEWANLTESQRTNTERARHNKVRARIKKADKELGESIACAERFDLSEEVADLLAGLRSAIRAQREAFNALAESQMFKVA